MVGKTLADQKHDQRQVLATLGPSAADPRPSAALATVKPGDADVALSMAHLLAAISLEMERKRGTL